VDTIAVSKFKATCLERLERVRRTGRPLLITKRGVPIAQVLPPPSPEPPASGFGVMAGTVTELGDILAPLDEDWEALR
jgi:prevent-host-death family protein